MATKKPTKKVAEKQANQFEVDPRQELYLAYYLDPKSETFSNSLQSALKAGYSQEYAEILSARLPKWLSEKVSTGYMLQKAEDNLKEFLEMNTVNIVGKGEDEKVIDDPQLRRIKLDATKFLLERRNKSYAAKQEVESNVNIIGVALGAEQAEQLIRARAERSNLQGDSK